LQNIVPYIAQKRYLAQTVDFYSKLNVFYTLLYSVIGTYFKTMIDITPYYSVTTNILSQKIQTEFESISFQVVEICSFMQKST